MVRCILATGIAGPAAALLEFCMICERNECMYCVCQEHVELAIDKFVDEYEEAPDLVQLRTVTFTAWTPPEHCIWCDRAAEVLVV